MLYLHQEVYEDDTTDKILTWVIAVFTGIGVYAITDIIMKRKFS